jgi:hypothetical protein
MYPINYKLKNMNNNFFKKNTHKNEGFASKFVEKFPFVYRPTSSKGFWFWRRGNVFFKIYFLVVVV